METVETGLDPPLRSSCVLPVKGYANVYQLRKGPKTLVRRCIVYTDAVAKIIRGRMDFTLCAHYAKRAAVMAAPVAAVPTALLNK